VDYIFQLNSSALKYKNQKIKKWPKIRWENWQGSFNRVGICSPASLRGDGHKSWLSPIPESISGYLGQVLDIRVVAQFVFGA